jgi:hypothetical protein
MILTSRQSLDGEPGPIVRSPIHGVAAFFHREQDRFGALWRPERPPHTRICGDDLDIPDYGWEQVPSLMSPMGDSLGLALLGSLLPSSQHARASTAMA